jgi:uncharacterized protein YjdB
MSASDVKAMIERISATTKLLTSQTTALNTLKTALAAATPFRVKVSQKRLNLVVGKAKRLYAGAYNAKGKRYAVTWKSSKKKVATVSGAGTIKAKRAGKATVTARSSNGKVSRITVKVVAKRPAASKAKVKKVKATGIIKKRKVGQVTYANPVYTPSTAISVKVTYRSSKPSVASVDKRGRILAKKVGTARIRIKAGTKSKVYTIKVSKA